MSLWKREGGWYWTDFALDGVRFRKPLKTCSKQEAKKREREMIKAAGNGQLELRGSPKRLFEAIKAYLTDKAVTASARTAKLESERLSLVKQHFGDVKLTAITPAAIAAFQRARHEAGVANRTINMDVGALRRVLKKFGRWRMLEDRVENLPENAKPIGRALSLDEQDRLMKAASSKAEWEHVWCAAVVAANTSMRPVEVKNLRWKHANLVDRTVSVERSKNASSHRVIPLNRSAVKAFAQMLERAERLGVAAPEHFIWPACRWGKIDATRPMKKWDSAWRSLRDAAGLPGLRFHDLRHTIITELAEMGIPDHVIESITGHLSRRMLEHYSHIRLDAKKKALDELDSRRSKGPENSQVATSIQ